MEDKLQQQPGRSGDATTSTSAREASMTVLSRSTLYAPLAAYHQTRVAPDQYLQTVKSLPRSVGEKALIQFLGHTSVHHHAQPNNNHKNDNDINNQQLPAVRHAKNTASRPLRMDEMQERLQQRSLTLIGGGFYSSSSSNKNNYSKNSNKKRSAAGNVLFSKSQKKKRKRPRNHVQFSSLRLSSDNEHVRHFLCGSEREFALALNRKWNDYAWSLLVVVPESEIHAKQPSSSEEEDWMVALTRLAGNRAQQLSERGVMEWVGAALEVANCQSHVSFQGRSGILCGETAHTWEVFCGGLPIGNNNNNGNSGTREKSQAVIASMHEEEAYLCRIPKRGTTLTVLLPVPNNKNTNDEEDEPKNDETSHELCITIQG